MMVMSGLFFVSVACYQIRFPFLRDVTRSSQVWPKEALIKRFFYRNLSVWSSTIYNGLKWTRGHL